MPPGPMGNGRDARNRKKQKPKNMKATVKRLFSYLEEEKGKIALALVCVLISSSANLGASYMLRPIINGLTGCKIQNCGTCNGLVHDGGCILPRSSGNICSGKNNDRCFAGNIEKNKRKSV